MQEYFEIGQIVNTSGLKGVVKVNPFTDDVRKFENLKKIFIEKKNELTEYEIEEVRYSKNQVLIKFKGIDTIEDAEKLRNCYLKIARKDEKPLPKDTYYIVDLIGLEVYLEDSTCIGKIIDVFSTGSNDVYVVRRDGKSDLLLPAIKDVIKEVNIEKGKMIVNLIKGLE